MEKQSRRFCFTLNNYTDEDFQRLTNLDKIKYIVIGKEIGEQGTNHLQGFVIFASGKRFATLKKKFPNVHWESTKGSNTQASEYCKKDGNFTEIGELPKEKGEAEKERWNSARKNAEKGNFDDIPDDIFIRYYGNLKKIHAEKQQVPESIEKLDFHWYYGPTGTGKSVKARNENPGYYIKGINKWWDGYTDQKCVIIEEWGPMDPSAQRIMGHYLKQWCDHHPFAAETKGGTKMLRPPKIIITSNWSLEECFQDSQITDPLKRRLQILHFHEPMMPIRAPSPPPPSPIFTDGNNNFYSLF